MPNVGKIGPYRLFFYSSNGVEPIHVHVERDDRVAKVWINPVRLQSSGGFGRSEMRDILSVVQENTEIIERMWHEYFD